MDIDMQHRQVYVHNACPCPWRMSMSMLQVHVMPHVPEHAWFPCPCCMPISVLHVLVHAACPVHAVSLCPYCESMDMFYTSMSMVLHVHTNAAYSSPCCISVYCCVDLKMQRWHGYAVWGVLKILHGHGTLHRHGCRIDMDMQHRHGSMDITSRMDKNM
jgi:hypothetical protein